MAKPKKDAQTAEVFGRALVDIPDLARCGEFVTIPADIAAQLEASGQFDPRAVEPKAAEQ